MLHILPDVISHIMHDLFADQARHNFKYYIYSKYEQLCEHQLSPPLEQKRRQHLLLRDSPFARELENLEMISAITPENAVSRLAMALDSGEDVIDYYQFIAANFSSIPGVETLDYDILEQILTHESLCIESENSFYDFIRTMGRQDGFRFIVQGMSSRASSTCTMPLWQS